MDFTLRAGERVLLTGPTGCGKSTLLRLLAGLLQRHGQGTFSGTIRVDGHDPASAPPRQRVRLLGFVSQEPHDQLVTGTVGDELAFAMGAAGHETSAINAALPALRDHAGLPVPLQHSTQALSGGQTQRLVTGAALSAGAELLLLDEPLAQLDPAGAQSLLARLSVLADQGVTVIIVEHRLEAVLPHMDRLLVMDAGQLVTDAPASALAAGLPLLGSLRKLGLSIPGMLDLTDRLGHAPEATAFAPPPTTAPRPTGPVLFDAVGLRHRYDGADTDAVAGIDLRVHAGERIALLGGNGAGKSTLLRMLAARKEAVTVAVPQDPDLSLFCASVREELAYGPQEARLPPPAVAARIEHAAAALSVSGLLDRAPQSLSRGQRMRTAVAAAVACQPALLLLDEPTAGQDHEQIERMMAALSDLLDDGALIFATHDVDLALRHATRAVVLDQGRIVADGPPATALQDLEAGLPVVLPPLAAFCQRAGLPLLDAATLARAARPGQTQLARPPARSQPRPQPVVDKPPHATGLDPRTRLGLLTAAGLLAVSLERPESLVLFAVLCGLPMLWLRVSLVWWRRGALAVAAIIWSTVLSQGLFYAEQPRISMGHIGPLHLYREGVVYGLAQSMRFVGLALAGLAVTASTPPDRMFAALARLRVPFGLALMAATALRFLPALGLEALTIRQARAARGRPVWQRTPLAWLALEISLLRPMVARAWRRAQNLAESLDTRGFDPLSPHAPRQPLVLRHRDRAVLVTAAAVSALVCGSRLLYVLYTAETLYLPSLRPLYGFVRLWL